MSNHITLPNITDVQIPCTTKLRLPEYVRRIALFAGDGDMSSGVILALHAYAVEHGILTEREIDLALINSLIADGKA